MILKYPIPENLVTMNHSTTNRKNSIYPQIILFKHESIHYYVPYDLQPVGTIEYNGYVMVTNMRLIVLKNNQIETQYTLESFEKIVYEDYIGCGVLIATIEQEEVLLVKFSMKHMTRFSYIARGTYSLSQIRRKSLGLSYEFTQEQMDMEITSREKELHCPKCDRALSNGKRCPKCDDHMAAFQSFILLCKPYLAKWIFISTLMIIMASINLLMPSVQKDFIDNVINSSNGTTMDIIKFVATMLVLSFALILVDFTKFKHTSALGSTITMDLRSKLYHKVQSLSLSFMNNRAPGDIMNRVVEDTQGIRDFMTNTFGEMFTTLVTMIGSLILMITIDPLLTLLSTMFVIVVALFNQLFHLKIRRLLHKHWSKKDSLNSLLQDIISGIRVVKSFGKENYEIDRFSKQNSNYLSVELALERFWAIFNPIISFLMGIGLYFAIYYGGLNVLEDRMTTGELIQFVAYTNTLYGPLGWISFLPRRVMQMLTCYERINEILDEEPEVQNTIESKEHNIVGIIEFEHVYFGYKVYNTVLEDITFKTQAGEMIGLVGSSGAGKSTLINLIMRLYNVNQGTIRIDNININDITLESLHSQIGVVLQETFLFSGSILNNIRYAKPKATLEEVIQASKTANAHDFISKMPDGYNTYVGEKGHKLSGGERQRIAIARAILHDPKILILDEATSALDTENEYLIQQALERLTKGRTTFAIAHRLSTLRNASRLIVIDGKKVAEIGTHNQLLEQQGIYYKLVTAQLEMQKVEKIEDLYELDLKMVE